MIVVKELQKKFDNYTAVDKISFEVKKGEIFGLLGENGAGKTTTLRMLATMLKPTSGSAALGGFDTVKQPEKVRAHIGILFGGETGLYDRLTAAENIAYFGELNGMDRAQIRKRSMELAEAFGMNEYMDKRAAKLSKGMKQKLAVCCAFVHGARTFLFDEPLIGIDPKGARELKNMILEARDSGSSVLISTHMLDTAERLCDRILIIQRGRKIAEGTLTELQEQAKMGGSPTLEDLFITLTEGSSEVEGAVIS
jgi:sodium transport system ATP-binding protein